MSAPPPTLADLRDLPAERRPRQSPWLRGGLSFGVAALVMAVVLALATPFGSDGSSAIPAFDTGFADGLRAGAEVAAEESADLEGVAFRRGLDVARTQQGPSSVADSAWLRRTIAGLSEASAARVAAVGPDYARGYLDGYRSVGGGGE